MPKTFLKAEWRKLLMLNYEVDPEVLQKFLPYKTEIDFWNNRCYISLVAFQFINTKVKGMKIPGHINFDEINLCFYVKHNKDNEWRRGVVLIKEIVAKPALAFIANRFYKENYVTMPIKHSSFLSENEISLQYEWKKDAWNSIGITTEAIANPIAAGSEEEFITEHYWGYTKINNNQTSQYRVEHPKWEVYKPKEYFVHVDFGNTYGEHFSFLTNQLPCSVFLAEGSPIQVKEGEIIH